MNGASVHTDVLVIGGGPIGAVAARAAAEAGAAVSLIDRRPDLGRSSACTGLISPRTPSILGIPPDCTVREIRSITVYAPGGRTLDLDADHTKALVIDRSVVERALHRAARAAGVDVQLGTEAVAVSEAGVLLQGDDMRWTVSAPVVIGADGPHSRVSEWFGLPRPEQFVYGVQAVVDGIDMPRPDRVEVFLGQTVAPGFFAWAVPAEGRTVRIGLGVVPGHDPAAHLDRLLEERFAGCRVIARTAGVIPVAAAPRTAADGVLLAGDAAGQVKPLSGGGLYPGATCARIAGRIAADAAVSGRPSHLLSSYESAWRSAVGREIAFGRSIRRMAATVSDRDLDAVFAACDDPDLLAFLAEHGDIDRFHRLPDKLAHHPPLWGKVLRLVPFVANAEVAGPSGGSPVAPTHETSL